MTGKLPLSGGGASIDELRQAESIIEARASELDLTRAAAGKWQTGLAALLAIVTGLSFTSISDQIRKLESPGSVIAAVALAVTFVVAVTALFLALRAAGGLPHLVGTSTLDGAAHRSAKSSANSLRAAIWLSILALMVFAVSVGILWFWPQAQKDQLSMVVTGSDSWCGTTDPIEGSTLVITEPGGEVHVVDVDEIVSWSHVDSCP